MDSQNPLRDIQEYRRRIEEITGFAPNFYSITPEESHRIPEPEEIPTHAKSMKPRRKYRNMSALREAATL